MKTDETSIPSSPTSYPANVVHSFLSAFVAALGGILDRPPELPRADVGEIFLASLYEMKGKANFSPSDEIAFHNLLKHFQSLKLPEK